MEPSDVDVDRAQAADQHGQLGRGQGQQLRLVDQNHLGGRGKSGLLVVAEAVRGRFKSGEGGGVRLLLRGIRAAGRERHRHLMAGGLRRLLDAGIAGQNDQVGQRDFLAVASPPG